MSPSVWRLAVALGLLLCAGSALAQEPANIQYRIYYSPAFSSQIMETPADPDGKYSGERADLAHKVEIELILFRYIGVSAARIPFYRQFQNKAGEQIDEYAEERMYSLTLYATEARHNSYNVLIGTGLGDIPEYRIKVDGVRQDDPLNRNLALRRNFIGVEYTFDRLGVRLEFDQITASNEAGGQKARLRQTFQFLTFYIPLN
jgi:hypothetical protein